MSADPHRTTVIKGAALTVAMRWTDRLIGLASTLILARLLAPEDFGIVAMASLVIGLLDVLLDIGINIALVQQKQPSQAHYDTAWTLRLIQTGLTALAIITVSPLAGAYFGDMRVVPVLQVMSANLILMGLENIGVVSYQKNMQFGLEFRFLFIRRIAGFTTTIVAALLLHSYWALVVGAITGRASGVILSYVMHPMRPRMGLSAFREIFSVSKWLLLRSIGGYLDANLHKIVVGRRTTSATMGAYSMADDISAIPSTELLAPLNRVLFPAFVDARNDHAELKRLFLLAQGIQTLVGIPAGVGLALVADEVVRLMLGEKWLNAVPFIQVLALTNVAQAISVSGTYVMVTLGNVRHVSLLSWIQVAVFSAIALILFQDAGALAIAKARLASVVLGLALAVHFLLKSLGALHIHDLVQTAIRPLLGAGIMATAIALIGDAFISSPVTSLALKVMTGIIAYPATVIGLWRLSGRPAGAEAYIIVKILSSRKASPKFS